jgi:hypothetical protein
MEVSALSCGVGGVMAHPKLFRGACEHEPACQPARLRDAQREMGWNDLEENQTYEVRLRF